MQVIWNRHKGKMCEDRSVIDSTVKELESIQKEVFPVGRWPDSYPPMPGILQERGQFLRAHGEAVEAFKLLVRSDFASIDPSNKTPTSKAYVAALLQLTVDVPAFIGHLMHYEIAIDVEKWFGRGQPKEEHDFDALQFCLLYHGFLSIALKAVEQHFGADTEMYAQTHWKLQFHEEVMKTLPVDTGDYMFGSIESQESFIKEQTKLLEWAGVSLNRLIPMSYTAGTNWTELG